MYYISRERLAVLAQKNSCLFPKV